MNNKSSHVDLSQRGAETNTRMQQSQYFCTVTNDSEEIVVVDKLWGLGYQEISN